MSSNAFDIAADKYQKQNPFDIAETKWKSQKKSKRTELEKIAVSAPAEFFGGAIGAIPGLATTSAQIQQPLSEIEDFSRPDYLPSSSLEPAPEKGLLNLFAALGRIPGIEMYTPESLRKKFRESTEGEFIPESKVGKVISHGASVAGQAIPFGAGSVPNLLRIAGGGIAGETLRELGAPEGVAFGAEVLSPAILAGMGKKIPLSGEEEALAKLSKKIGMNDKQIAAVLKSPKSQATFAKFAAKGKKAENLVQSMFDNLGDQYQALKSEGRAQGPIAANKLENMLEKWKKILFDLEQTHKPSADKASAIDYIKDIINNVDSQGSNVEKLINAYQDINRTVNWNAWSGGKKQLAALKEPIKEAIISSSPMIGKDFVATNQLYQRSIHLAKLLKPTELEKLLAHGHAGEIALGLATWNPGLLNKYLGFLGGRQLSKHMLFSPKFNKMHTKMMAAIKKNDTVGINQILQNFQNEIKNTFGDSAEDFEVPDYH